MRCRINPAGKAVMRLEIRTGPSPVTKPKIAQTITPEVNIKYIPSEMPEVSRVRRVFRA